jgi:hypothetical protein
VTAEHNPGVTIALVIAAVTVSSGFLAVGMWAAWKGAERAEADARYRRRILLRLGLLYVGCAIFGIAEVLTGSAPKESLFGLPVAAVLAWAYLRAAVRVKAPPV